MPPPAPLVGLVEPWHGESHASFIAGLERHLRAPTTRITMDAEKWRWRMRLGSWPLSLMLHSLQPWPDVFLMSDYVNLPSLMGFEPRLAGTPIALYFHENQLTYPLRKGLKRDHEFAAINVLSCLAADRCIFCSRQQQESFLDALPPFFAHDGAIDPVTAITHIENKCQVIPVGCEFADLDYARLTRQDRTGRPLRIVWPHRFEHDKNPADFFDVLMELAAEGLDFEFAAIGMSRGALPAVMEQARVALGDRCVAWGYQQGTAYAETLAACDLVVSTAWQETLGLAVIEAIRAGCVPLLPNRLSYPEVLGPALAAAHTYENKAHLRRVLRGMMRIPDPIRRPNDIWREMDRFAWTSVAPRFDSLFKDLS